MEKGYDMIVIGAGSGGLSMALGLHQLGLKVLLIDKTDQSIGGECLNNGCVPSKAFLHATRTIAKARAASRFGMWYQGQPSMKSIREYVTAAQEKIRTHENAHYFRNMGLDVVLGQAYFSGKNQVTVAGNHYQAKKITLATGSKPLKLNVPGVELVNYYDNENIWELAEIPATILLVGAGPINMELGQAFNRIGSRVIVVEISDRILVKEDREISDILFQQLESQGIEFYLNCRIERFKDENTAVLVGEDGVAEMHFDALLVGIGRDINCRNLDPEAAGIILKESGAPVLDRYLRTSNKNILAIGDVTGGPQFSHAAELQATTMIRNLFTPFKKKIKYDHFSWVTFTDPEIATFGHTEIQLKEKGHRYRRLVLDFDEDDRAITGDYTYGKLILFVSHNKLPWANSRLLGGSMIAPNAGEMIQELVLASSARLGIRSLFNKIYPYPTGSRVNKTLVMNKYMDSIKPWMKRLLRLCY